MNALFLSLLHAQSAELSLPLYPAVPKKNSWLQFEKFYAYRDGDDLYFQSTKVLGAGAEKTAYLGWKFFREVDETTTTLGADEVVFLVPNKPGTWNSHEFSLIEEVEETGTPYLVQTIAHKCFGKGRGRTGCAIQDRLMTLPEYLKDHPDISDETLHLLYTNYHRGLSALHAAGYVHKDIKSENLFVTYDETPQGLIGDFGCSAKISEMGSPAVGMGFPSYSPELLGKATSLYRGFCASPDFSDREKTLAESALRAIATVRKERGESDVEIPDSPPLLDRRALSEELLCFTPRDDIFALDIIWRKINKGS